MHASSFMAVAAAACVSAAAAAGASKIFPTPRVFSAEDGEFSFSALRLTSTSPAASTSARFARMMDRYSGILNATAHRAGAGASSSSRDEGLVGENGGGPASTYSLSFDSSSASPSSVAVRAANVYAAQYALESLSQLITPCGGGGGSGGSPRSFGSCLPSAFSVEDGASYSWRGLMLDTGRRFFPPPTLNGIMDVMAAAKMNVLHLHASDFCRWSVESKKFPNLTSSLSGVYRGFYTQDDVASMVAYAGDRGIRVVAEFDVPGHSRGFIPLQYSAAPGAPNPVQFCEPDDPTRSQLYGDPNNNTLTVLQDLFKEMASLFPDPVFHIGGDETSALGPCTVESTFALERSVLDYVQSGLGKTPAGWEEIMFDAGASTPATVVYAWSRYTPVDIIARGNKAVDSQSSHFYLTEAAAAGPAGWGSFYYDISTGLNATALPSLLGGETAMWSDTYCTIEQCGAFTGPDPVGSALFPPEQDAAFTASIGGMIWPRSFVGAASFWNYNASVGSDDPAFVASVNALTTSVIARGLYACPVGCTCDQVSACGVPYITPPKPAAGDAVYGVGCSDPVAPTQSWNFTATGQLAVGGGALCVLVGGYDIYPLTLGSCADPKAASWTHVPATSEIVLAASSPPTCLDMGKTADATGYTVGTFECGSGSGIYQNNQQWVADPVSGLVVSLYEGMCLAAVAAA